MTPIVIVCSRAKTYLDPRAVTVSFIGRSFYSNPAAAVSATKRKAAREIRERLSGELLGLTRGCDLRKEGVTVT